MYHTSFYTFHGLKSFLTPSVLVVDRLWAGEKVGKRGSRDNAREVQQEQSGVKPERRILRFNIVCLLMSNRRILKDK